VASRSIAELVVVPAERRDLTWLTDSLQAAVELELSTIPPYLCALWSIKTPTPDDPGSVYGLIRSVVLEEMLHMGLASNLLTTIGGTPELSLPGYPGHLPGGVHPQLLVGLSGLTKEAVKVFMEIELPEKQQRRRAEATAESYPTIGAFYDAISQAFGDLGPSIVTGDRQLTIRIGSEQLVAIRTLEQAQAAITVIKEQGEGTPGDPEVAVSGNELAHYFKFGEIYHGKTYVKVGNSWGYDGAPVPFPDAWPMLEVPEGGYPEQDAVRSFDERFMSVMSDLQEAWQARGGDGAARLAHAVGTMFNLAPLAQAIMQVPVPGKRGTYGPDFRAPVAAPVSFRTDIAPMFQRFRGQMLWRFDLTDYEHVKANAQTIYSRISDPGGPMPPPLYEPLEPEQVRRFRRWIDEGCPA